jgi:Adaptin N terminal region
MMNACKQSARSHMAVCVRMLLLLLPVQNAEVIKRWLNEVQEAVTSRAPMVQFHAVALLHALRASDRLAVSKLVGQLTRSGVRSPMAQVLLIRYVSQVQLCARAQGGGQQQYVRGWGVLLWVAVVTAQLPPAPPATTACATCDAAAAAHSHMHASYVQR